MFLKSGVDTRIVKENLRRGGGGVHSPEKK